MSNGVQWEEEEFNDNPIEMKGTDPRTGQPIWGEKDQSDIPQPVRQPRPQYQAPVVEEEIFEEEEVEASNEEDDEDYTVILSDARLRLEQGKLYEMVMNNDIFQDVAIDPRAVKHVQREIRKFARERMEIMLGMRQESQVTGTSNLVLPFNDLEVSILKTLASKATNGATESPDADKYAGWKEQKTGLTPIGTPKTAKATPLPATAKKPMQPKAKVKVQTRKPQTDLPAEFEPEYMPLEKPAYMLTEAERIQRHRESMERQADKKAVKSKEALPMPSYEQQEMLYSQRAAGAKAMGTGLSVSAIMKLVESAKK